MRDVARRNGAEDAAANGLAQSCTSRHNLACLTNVAISMVRLKSQFDDLPQAHRHYARCPEHAVRHLLESATP